MTAQASIPLKWYVPFAQGDSSRVELPVTTADPTRASQTLGFPPLTMQPPESGGVPPQGEDFNGGLNQVARIAWWVLNGGGWPYDATFATNSNINGYPNGATLQAADFRGNWINTADNNQNNPDTNGTNWVPGFQYGTTALTGLTGGTVTPTPAQAAKGAITLAGTLGSALTVILPNWVKNWTITNNTTGAFVTIVKTAAGSGVTIPQNASPTRVSGDGTNIVQAPENIAAATTGTNAMQFGQATGRVLRTTIYENIGGTQMVSVDGGAFTATGAASFSTQTLTTKTRYKIHGGAGAGGGAQGTGAGQQSVGGGGGCGGIGEGFILGALVGTTITVGAGGVPGAAGLVAGGNGGASSISALVSATGGSGGSAGPLTASFPLVTAGGPGGIVPTNAGTLQTVQAQGPAGGGGLNLAVANVASGAGGNSAIGGGGQAVGGTANGAPGVGLNAGGSGGVCFGSIAGGRAGGAGTAGYIELTEYA